MTGHITFSNKSEEILLFFGDSFLIAAQEEEEEEGEGEGEGEGDGDDVVVVDDTDDSVFKIV